MSPLHVTTVTLTEDCLESIELLMEEVNQYTHPAVSRSELIEQLCWQCEALRETAEHSGWKVSPKRRKPGRPWPDKEAVDG